MQVVDSARAAAPNHARHIQAAPAASTARRLKDRMREQIRLEGKSRRTFEAYWHWSASFIRWSGMRHPSDMGKAEVEQFLNWLVNTRECSESTHSQALNALLYLYQRVLGIDPPWLSNLTKPQRPRRLPVVLTEDEVRRVLSKTRGTTGLVLPRKVSQPCLAMQHSSRYGRGMAYTQSDLDAIDAAIASGEMIVQVEGRRVQYRSIDELMQARRHVADQITHTSGSTRRSLYRFRFTTSRE